MKPLRKRVFVGAGNTTVFMGTGRKEFDPRKPLKDFDEYLAETAQGTLSHISSPEFDEGVIGSFMSGRFINQANLPGFLPFMTPSLTGKPCTAVEGACGTGGRAIDVGTKAILADCADAVLVAGFEMQNRVKAVYGADILAGAAFYKKERKAGHAHFFPGIFDARAGAYYEKYGYEMARKGMAKWFEQSILHARKNPKAQEYANKVEDLLALGMTPPNAEKFLPHLNVFDCSKVSDGAASLALFSEEGLARCGVKMEDCVELVALAGAEGDITQMPDDQTRLATTAIAVERALKQAGLTLSAIGVLEIHDCFTITALLALETIGFAGPGQAPRFILEGKTAVNGQIPTNLSGGLGGFGHPTGATGVRQMVDLWQQLTGRAANQCRLQTPYGMMISMGGNDKTVTCAIVKKTGL